MVNPTSSTKAGTSNSSTSTTERDRPWSRFPCQLRQAGGPARPASVTPVVGTSSRRPSEHVYSSAKLAHFSLKMDFISHLQRQLYFPLSNINTSVSSCSYGILTLKRGGKASFGGERFSACHLIFLFQKPVTHAILCY